MNRVPEFPNNAKAITASANPLTDNDGNAASMSVYAGGAGTVTVVPAGHSENNQTVTFTVPAGGVIPVRVRLVTAATATSLVGVW